jgi:hypothetical protein
MAKGTLTQATPDAPIFREGFSSFVPVPRRAHATDGSTPKVNGTKVVPLPMEEREAYRGDPTDGLMLDEGDDAPADQPPPPKK